jgi:hypothetical protein
VGTFADLVESMDRVVQAKLDGETVTYDPAAGAAVQVVGVFSETASIAKGTAEAGVEVLGPSIFFRLDDLPVDPEDDEPAITIRGNVYEVIRRIPDGMGGVTLELRLDA